MTPGLSYDYEGERKRRAKITNGMGKNNGWWRVLRTHAYWYVIRTRYVRTAAVTAATAATAAAAAAAAVS